MARCSACGTAILFGGSREGELRFCNAKCHAKGRLLIASRQLPPAMVTEATGNVFRGSCPKCHGPGPVDVHTSYRIWSAVFLTSWQNTPHVCCRGCGRKAQLGDLAISLFVGWWGFPWGLIMTPVQIGRNLTAIFRADAEQPSQALENVVRMSIVSNAMAAQAAKTS